jgi:hypothetical protein
MTLFQVGQCVSLPFAIGPLLLNRLNRKTQHIVFTGQ